MSRTCPICGKPAAPRAGDRAFPFCSDRCRLVDLGEWLGEAYRIPGPRPGDGNDLASRPDGGEEKDA